MSLSYADITRTKIYRACINCNTISTRTSGLNTSIPEGYYDSHNLFERCGKCGCPELYYTCKLSDKLSNSKEKKSIQNKCQISEYIKNEKDDFKQVSDRPKYEKYDFENDLYVAKNHKGKKSKVIIHKGKKKTKKKKRRLFKNNQKRRKKEFYKSFNRQVTYRSHYYKIEKEGFINNYEEIEYCYRNNEEDYHWDDRYDDDDDDDDDDDWNVYRYYDELDDWDEYHNDYPNISYYQFQMEILSESHDYYSRNYNY